MTSQAEYRNLCFVTWNTNGIKGKAKSKSRQKISKVLDSLNTLQADIVFIQETHIGPKCYQIFKKVEQDGWNVFFTVHSPKSKGVAILIKRGIKFEYICHDEDCSGGYIVLFCYLYGELYTLVNVYNHKEDRTLLGRLKEYLSETAEGVLVVGGDFNTVLHPSFDRKSSKQTFRHSQFRNLLEDFTVSLNLKDSWSYLHPTEDGFTRRQNPSYSRLDMFFMPEDKMKQVLNNTVQPQEISDHYPLVLTLTLCTKNKNKIPNVAALLREHKYTSDPRAGKISGAEILNAIKSLPDSEEHRPDELHVYTYKKYRCSLTEILKLHFNNMVKSKRLYTSFNESYSLEDRHIFNVDYLIFSHILAKRLNAFITPSFKGKTDENLCTVHRMTIDKGEQKISWLFLSEALCKLKMDPSVPPPDFSILDNVLPKVKSSDDLRHLQLGFPLTNIILNLALKHLQDKVFDLRYKCEELTHPRGKHSKSKCKRIMSIASVCYHRKALKIYTQLNGDEKENIVTNFIGEVKNSALKVVP